MKTRTKHASKGGIVLAVFKAFQEVLIDAVLRVRGHGAGPRSPARSTARRRALLRSHRGLRRIQTNTQSRKRNIGFIVEFDSETIKIWR